MKLMKQKVMNQIQEEYHSYQKHDSSFKRHQIAFLNDPKCEKEVFLTQVCWIDLILHNVIVLNVFKHSATSPDHEGSSKDRKYPFLNDPKGQNEVFGHFLELACWINLISHIVIVLNVFYHSTMLPGQVGSFKNQKNAFLNDPKSQKRGFWPFS